MIKAKFNGANYACAEFNAKKGDTVSMPNARMDAIVAEGKSDQFEVVSNDASEFPAQTTVGPK